MEEFGYPHIGHTLQNSDMKISGVQTQLITLCKHHRGLSSRLIPLETPYYHEY